MPVDVRAATPDELQAAFALRLAVFCDEQGVARELELDEHDAGARHLVAVARGAVVGTMRWRLTCGGARAKIERVAVAREHRGRGIGEALMRHALAELDALPAVEDSVMHAQTHATAFYERPGYVAEGLPFDQDGLPHIVMRRRSGERR
jgi:predicted GNAT family N-acyltransferase